MHLHGRTALLTGASQGLGLALAFALARRGARLALVARREAPLHAAVRALRDEGFEAHALVGDVGDKLHAHRIAGAAAALLGPVDLLVHNASTLGPVPLRPLLDTDCESLDEALAVNVVGPFRLTKIVAGSMALRGDGTVLFVSSDAAVEAYPTWGAYGLSKAAADHMARIWAAELQGTNVTVASLDPGEMDTALHAAAMPDADRSALARPDAVARAIVDALADGRITTGARHTLSQLAVSR